MCTYKHKKIEIKIRWRAINENIHYWCMPSTHMHICAYTLTRVHTYINTCSTWHIWISFRIQRGHVIFGSWTLSFRVSKAVAICISNRFSGILLLSWITQWEHCSDYSTKTLIGGNTTSSLNKTTLHYPTVDSGSKVEPSFPGFEAACIWPALGFWVDIQRTRHMRVLSPCKRCCCDVLILSVRRYLFLP